MGKKGPGQKSAAGRVAMVAGVAVLAVGAMIGISRYTANKPADPGQSANLVSDGNLLGKKDAKVTIIEYGDFY